MPKEPDTIEDLPAPAAAEDGKKSGGGNPFIVIIANIILIPVLTVVLFEFYIFPKIKTMQGGEGHAEVAASHDSGGGDHGGGGHGSGDGHGGGHTYAFDNIVANLSGALQSRYVKVSFTLEGRSKDFEAKMQQNEAKLIDATLVTLSRLTLQDLEKPEVKNIIRADLLNEYGRVLNGDYVDQLYFSEFVVQ